jgi:hypothetical protein
MVCFGVFAMLYVALFLTAVLLLVANLSARWCGPRSPVPTVLCIVCVPAGFFCLFHSLFAFNAFLVAIAVGTCAAAGARPSRVLIASVGMTAVAYGLFSIYFIAPEIEEWSELKEEFPMESMSDRLAYEQRRPVSGAETEEYQADAAYQGRLTDIEKRADDVTKSLNYQWRVNGLERLHAGTVQQFIEARGFGVGRMLMRPSPAALKLSQREIVG